MTDPVLEVEHLNVSYQVEAGNLQAVHDVSFQLFPNQMLGLVGESGCGKTTVASSLLRMLPANATVTNGSIRFRGQDLLGLPDEEIRRLRGSEIAMVFQDPLSSLNPTMTVGRQLMNVAASHSDTRAMSRGDRRERALDLLAEVGIPDPTHRFDDYPHQFSGGMRQRVMIAMALMLEPAVLIADEATSALDVTLQKQILDILRRLQFSRGTSVLLVSHDLGVIAETCDRVVVMYAGRVVEQADTVPLFRGPKHPYTEALLSSIPSYARRHEGLKGIPGVVVGLDDLPVGCKFADRCIHQHARCRESEPTLVGDSGHQARCFLLDPASGVTPVTTGSMAHQVTPARRREAAPMLLGLRGISTHFGAKNGFFARVTGHAPTPVKAVDGIDLDVVQGEVLGVVGESGSGKTTLGLTILRLATATAGEITFDGIDLHTRDPQELRVLRRRMQMVFQDPTASLSPRMRVERLVTEPYRINKVPADEQYSVRELMELVQLNEEQGSKYPHQLSSGQARRVGIARALAMQPDLIVADEPTSGLDVSAAANVLILMDRLRREMGITYILISHDLNVVTQIADRIAVMYLGRIVELGPVDDIISKQLHPYTQGLLAAVPQPDPEAPRHDNVPPGEVPSPRNPPSGCHFHPRCRFAQDLCRDEAPALIETSADHKVACHFWELADKTSPQPVTLNLRSHPDHSTA